MIHINTSLYSIKIRIKTPILTYTFTLQLEIKHHIPHEASHSIDDLLVPPVVVKENRQELTLYEIQAISDLARGSSVSLLIEFCVDFVVWSLRFS